MTVPVNNNQLVGDFLPKVFVNRILLTESGGSTDTRGDNPHFDIPSYEQTFKDKVTGMEGKFQGLKEDEKTTLSTYGAAHKKGNKSFSARIDLNFKDSIENSLLGTWFNNEDLKKMIKVQVIASVASSTSQNIQHLIYAIKNGNVSVETLGSVIQGDSRVTSQYFTLAQGGGPNTGNIITHSNYDTPGGQTTYNIKSSLQFKFAKPNINHLTFFVLPYIDRTTLENHFEPPIDLSTISYSSLVGDCRTEPVINNGEVVTTANYFTDEAGVLYFGEVSWTMDELNSSSGLRPVAKETGAILTEQIITNTVIQDFRQQNLVKKIDIDFSDVKKNLNVSGFTKKQFFSEKLNNSLGFYSPVMSTRSPKGDMKLIFGINLEWFMRKNSPYGKLWDNFTPGQKENLFNSKLFKSVSLIRKRVKGIDDARLLDENIPPEVVTTANLISSKSSQMSNAGKNSILTRISIDQFNMSEAKKKFVYFSARDADITKQGPGYYQYGLRYTFNDPILHTVQNLVLSLAQDFKVYQQFVDVSRNPKYYNAYADSFTKSFSSQLGEWGGVVPIMLSNFIMLRNILTGEHLSEGKPNDKAKEIYINLLNITHPKVGNPQGVELLLNLVDELLSTASELFEVKSISNTAQGIRNPAPATPKAETKITIREVYFSHQLGGIVDTRVNKNLGYDFLWKPTDEGILQNTGVNGKIKISRTSPQGLSAFSYDYFEERIKQETNKYFTSDQLALDLSLPKISKTVKSRLNAQKYMFLSPSLAQTPHLGFIPILSNGTNKIDYDRLNTLYTEIIKRKLNNLDTGFKVDKKEFKFLSQNDKEQKYQLEQIISLKGGSVVSTDRSGAELFGLVNPPIEEGQNISFNNVGSPLGPSQTETEEQSSFTTLGSGVPSHPDGTLSELLQETNYNDALLGLTIVDAHGGIFGLKKFSNRINGGGITLNDLVPLPNQLKQLVVLNAVGANLNDVQNILDIQALGPQPLGGDDLTFNRLDLPQIQKLEKQFGIWMNYFNLVKVQVFGGFQSSDAAAHDNSPGDAFVDLTPQHFTIIKNSNMRALCRLTPYVNEDLDIQTDNTLSLPIFDQYFILEAGPGPVAVVSATQNLASMTNLLNGMSSHMDALETPSDYVNTGGLYGAAGKSPSSLGGKTQATSETASQPGGPTGQKESQDSAFKPKWEDY